MRPRSFNSGEIKRKYRLFLVWFVAAAVMLGMAPPRVVHAFNVTAGNVAELITAINNANDEVANPGADTINLATDGTYTLIEANNGDNGLPVIDSEITINGNGATIERSSAVGTPQFRIFSVAEDGNLTLNDLTVENGYAPLSDGGGILNFEGTLTITNSTLSRNIAESDGGGIDNNFGTVTITNSTLSDNDAGEDCGGICNLGTVTITNSTLSNNGADVRGGGILNFEGILTITNSTLSGNAAFVGGGIYNVDSNNVTLTNSTLSGNDAEEFGGGIYNDGAKVEITNSTLSGNAAFVGGGIFNDTGSTATITNSTLSGNVADGNGGGIRNFGTVKITNSIVANSPSGVNCTNSGSFTATGSNVDTDGTCLGFAQVTPADLNLGPLFFNGGPTQTHALIAGSVAINAGDQAECTANNITRDQRGFLRDSLCDLGSFEFGASLQADLLISLGVDKTSVKQGQLLTYTITVHNFGADTAQNVVVNDTLSTGTTFVSAATNKGNITTKPPVGQTGTVTWALGDLLDEEGGSATLVVKVLVKGKTTVTNTATVSSATVDPNPANNTAAITVSVAPGTSKR